MNRFQEVGRFCVIALMVIFACSFHNSSSHQKKTDHSSKGFAIVELFTSEGCSSCPAAEALALRVADQNISNVYIIAFHVDYWNRLGWNDMYSNSEYTDRQRQYAGFFNLKSLYTPQMVVNGKFEFVGSDESRLRATIQQGLKDSSHTMIELQARLTTSKVVSVSCSSNSIDNSLLNIALVQRSAEATIKAGENKGRVVKHINIVRGFKKVALLRGINSQATFALPNGLSAKDCKIFAYVQNRNDLKITAVAAGDIE